jgi:hypothetical protein
LASPNALSHFLILKASNGADDSAFSYTESVLNKNQTAITCQRIYIPSTIASGDALALKHNAGAFLEAGNPIKAPVQAHEDGFFRERGEVLDITTTVRSSTAFSRQLHNTATADLRPNILDPAKIRCPHPPCPPLSFPSCFASR